MTKRFVSAFLVFFFAGGVFALTVRIAVLTPSPVNLPPAVVVQTEPVTPPPVLPSVRLLAAGDVMLGRHVGALLRSQGDDYPFRNIALHGTDRFFSYDEFLINLEGPIAGDDPSCTTCMSFSFAESVAPLLAKQGVTLASLANNHGLDRGENGYASTHRLLLENGIAPFGKLRLVGAESSVIRKTNGLRIAYVGFAVFPGFDAAAAEALVQELDDSADVVIVVVHWGNEYQAKPTAQQKELAHAWIDAGADLIIGHHPHWMQSVEVYNNRQIFYSLGNFVFDQYWSAETQQGLLVGFAIVQNAVTAKLFPITMERAQPLVLDGDQRIDRLERLGEISDLDENHRQQVLEGTLLVAW